MQAPGYAGGHDSVYSIDDFMPISSNHYRLCYDKFGFVLGIAILNQHLNYLSEILEDASPSFEMKTSSTTSKSL